MIDFVDLPLQENVGRNEGLSFDTTIAALGTLLAHPAVASLTICELNPDHDPDGSAVPRFVEGIVERARSIAPAGSRPHGILVQRRQRRPGTNRHRTRSRYVRYSGYFATSIDSSWRDFSSRTTVSETVAMSASGDRTSDQPVASSSNPP